MYFPFAAYFFPETNNQSHFISMCTCFRVFGHPLNLLLRAAWVLKEFACSVGPLQNDHLGRGQKKLTVVDRWPLWEGGGRGVI